MFVSADQLWLEGLEDRLPLHVLEFYWDKFEPKLTCYDTAREKTVELDMAPADFVVSKRKTCVGRFEGEKYFRCPNNTPVTKFPQCDLCAGESFIKDQECIFEPKCEGEICDSEFCRRQHVLYLAFYDTMVKVGMSSTRRVEKRLVEQGADAFAIIGSYPNRKRAREAEKDIASKLDLPQGIRQQTILSRFSRALDVHGMDVRYEGLKTAIAEKYGLSVEPLRRLSSYPLELPLPRAPQLQTTSGVHRGRLLGLKGKWLVYESGEIKALNMPDLVGRYMARGAPRHRLKTNK
jgi:hypothetical protein